MHVDISFIRSRDHNTQAVACRTNISTALNTYRGDIFDRLRVDFQHVSKSTYDIEDTLDSMTKQLASSCEKALVALAERIQKTGRTRLPRRLVHRSVLTDSGYEFHEEVRRRSPSFMV